MAESYRNRIDVRDEAFDSALAFNDLGRMKEQEEVEKNESSKLSFAGIGALAAGIGLFMVNGFSWIGVKLAELFGGTSFEIMDGLKNALPAVGFFALIYGVIKMLRLVFRRKELDFPSLNVYRKRIRTAAENTTNRAQGRTQSYDTAYDERGRTRYNRKEATASMPRTSKLRKSRRRRVFAGVAGGIAEYTGVSVGLIRFGMLVALFASGFFPVGFAYILLSIVLPNSYDDYES